MANRKPFSYPRFRAFDGKGKPLEGGTAEFFDAGTTNNRTVYSDPELNTATPNPITLNSRGEPESGGGTPIDIYFDSSAYKIVLKDSDGNTVWTIDNFIQDDLSDISEPKDPKDATDTGTDTFEGTLNRDPNSGEEFVLDFQSANTTTAPTFENTGGSLGALTIKTRDGSALWAGALEGIHTLKYDGTDYLLRDPALNSGAEYAAAMDQGVATGDSPVFDSPVFSELTVNGQLKEDPEHATDSGTDTFDSATNTSPSGNGKVILRDFQSANTTTTPTLDTLTITARDGSALWANALSGVHELQLNAGGTAWLVLDPIPNIPASTDLLDEDDMASDSATAVPTQQSAKFYIDNHSPINLVTDFDADDTGASSVTTAFNNALAEAKSSGREIFVPPGDYLFDSKPNDIDFALRLRGAGINVTTFERNYTESGGDQVGLMNFRTDAIDGFTVDSLSVLATGGSGGCGLSVVAASGENPSWYTLRNMRISSVPDDGFSRSLEIDGDANTTAPIGTRDINLHNVYLFNGSTGVAAFRTVLHFHWTGGGALEAGGTGTDGIRISGASSTERCEDLVIHAESLTDVNLDSVRRLVWVGPITGDLNNTSNVDDCVVLGYVGGTVQTSWVNSTHYGA